MIFEFIDSCASTNASMPSDAPHGYVLMAREQTAGRGQRGNSWEAAPGMNVTMSVMLRPQGLPAAAQFAISEAVAMGVVDLLDSLGVDGARVKWPNDIYVGDRKVCGILIENSLCGTIVGRSVAGVGLNVNQREFVGGAPNPVSLRQLLGRDLDVESTGRSLALSVLERFGSEGLHAAYMARLWRGQGIWPWITDGGERFDGSVDGVMPTGHIVIGGRTFAFKEVWPADIKDPAKRGTARGPEGC